MADAKKAPERQPTEDGPDRKRDRSPNYPQISFPASLQLARKVYDAEKRHSMPAAVAVQHLGYQGLNGRSRGILSAVKKYGLLEGDGDDVRISDAAYALFVLPEDDKQQRPAIIRSLALKPTIFEELLAEFPGGRPSDQNLRSHLLLKRGFTEQAVGSVVASFKETMEVVNALPPAPEAQESPPSDEQPPDRTLLQDLFAPRAKTGTPPQAATPSADIQVWSLSEGVRVELRIIGKLGPRQVKKLRGFIEVFLSDMDYEAAEADATTP